MYAMSLNSVQHHVSPPRKTIIALLKQIVLLIVPLLLTACAAHVQPARVIDSFPSSLPMTPPPNITFATGAEEGFDLALAAYRAGDWETSLLLSRQVLDVFPDTSWYKRALFLMERSLIQLDRTEEARAAMLRVQAEYPEMADYALYAFAEYLFADARYTEAAAVYQQVAERYPASSLVVRSTFRQGQALLEFYAYPQAMDVFAQFLIDNPGSELAPEAGLALGRALTAEADLAQAVRTYQDLWIRYPGSATDPAVEKVLNDLRGGGVDVPALSPAELYERGVNLYRTSQHDKAVETFVKLLEQAPQFPNAPDIHLKTGISLFNLGRRVEAAAMLENMIAKYPGDERVPEALNWLGKSYSKLGEREKGVKTFQRLISNYPACTWADDALYYIGNIYREAGDMKKSLTYYARLAAEYPDSSFADSAFWWQAWAHYIAGEYRRSEQLLQELVIRYPRSFLVKQARYWQGRTAEKTGNPGRAAVYYEKVLKRGPYSYYGYRAAERLSHIGVLEAATKLETVTDPEAPCEKEPCPDNLADQQVMDDGPPVWTEDAKIILAAEPSFNKTLELMHLDMKKEAAAELWLLQDRAPKKRGALIALSKAFFELGDYYRSLLLVLRNYDRYLDGRVRQTPDDFWLLAYPQGYWDSIVLHSRKYGQDPFFIAAIIREESQFRAEALSPAGARGVMQVMPATGEWIAKTISLPGFDRSRLFESDIAINVGTWYISHLMKRFNNDALLVAAAYNAGPEAASSWQQKNGASLAPDEFVELIPFSETRGYVKKVLRNYAEYRRIYGRQSQNNPLSSPRTVREQETDLTTGNAELGARHAE